MFIREDTARMELHVHDCIVPCLSISDQTSFFDSENNCNCLLANILSCR